ncbi:hypothetical protein LA080_000955 [Diaporthe eres]|uniref:Uncharacterized protein n=1 Tax=Diaporthe vaccinii TaxID=105482 RepID=A0ABR4DTW6_9PEZI|nr:hypothetical protein LA080_000955 [Diaporthe eres]
MAASNSTNGPRSGKFVESLQNAAPQVVPSSSKSGNVDEVVETSEPVESELPAVSDDEPVHFVAELAAVSTHDDIDHPMPDAPPPVAGVPGGTDETFDHAMPDAPGLDSAVPEEPQAVEDVVMEDAPPLDQGEE